MIWVSWRQQRTETLIAVGILVALAALLVPTGLQMASAYHHDGLSGCLGAHNPPCDEAIRAFTSRFHSIGTLISWFTLVPGLIGVLLAAPFIVQLEQGTNRLDWTQSVTRGRWIATKLGLAIAAAVLVSLCLTVLITWWHTPITRLDGRMDNSVFDSEGTVVLGYTLFALGLAVAVGVVWRRAVAALVVAFVGYFAARLFVDTWLRQRFLTLSTLTWRPHGAPPSALEHAWVLREYPSDSHGQVVPVPCRGVLRSQGAAAINKCLAEGPSYMHAVYEPANRFWALQGIETALFGGIAIVAIAFAAWWTHQRAG